MVIKTKKYKMESGAYMRIGLVNVLKEQWWVALIAVGLMLPVIFVPSHWWITGALIAYILYVLFWTVQFAGLTQLEQSKFLFEKLSYEITSQQILIKLNTKQGMPLKWEQIKKAEKRKEQFIIYLSKVQFVYLPFKVFNSENDRKFFETILKRKEYLKNEGA